jgi:hypothetical protein
MKKLIDDALSDTGDSDDMIPDTAVDDLIEPELGVVQKTSKKDDTRKANDRNKSDNRGPTKRTRTGAITTAILCIHSIARITHRTCRTLPAPTPLLYSEELYSAPILISRTMY